MLCFLLTLCETDEQREKLKIVFEKHYKLLLKRAFYIVRDHGLAEDIVQEAFVRFINCKYTIDDPESEKTRNLLLVLVTNISKDTLRSHRYKEIPSDFDELFGDVLAANEEIYDEPEYKELIDAINALSEKSRDVLYLCNVLGCSSREVSKLLNISESNVRKRAERARNELEKVLCETNAQ